MTSILCPKCGSPTVIFAWKFTTDTIIRECENGHLIAKTRGYSDWEAV